MLFGIDVIVIGPGMVVTPIWDKADAVDTTRYADTPYAGPIARLKQYLLSAAKTGLSPERIGEEVKRALTVARPKVRSRVAPNPLTHWIADILPRRVMDMMIARQLGLKYDAARSPPRRLDAALAQPSNNLHASAVRRRSARAGREIGEPVGELNAQAYRRFARVEFRKRWTRCSESRGDIFERLHWDVVVKDGHERDRFDDLNPLYLVRSIRSPGNIGAPSACCRRLDRTCCETSFRNCSKKAKLWKARRSGRARAFARRGRRPAAAKENGVNYVMNELIAGIGEVAAARRPDANRLRIRRSDLSCPEKRSVASRRNRKTAADRYRDGLRGLFEPDVPGSNRSARTGDGSVGPCARRQGTRLRMKT